MGREDWCKSNKALCAMTFGCSCNTSRGSLVYCCAGPYDEALFKKRYIAVSCGWAFLALALVGIIVGVTWYCCILCKPDPSENVKVGVNGVVGTVVAVEQPGVKLANDTCQQ